MKFEAKYPGSRPGDEPQPGLIKGWHPPDLCRTCNAPTDWVDISFGADLHLCSDECMSEFNNRVDADLRRLAMREHHD